MPLARLDTTALRIARIPLDAPLCLRPTCWNGEIELPEEAPDVPDLIADGVALVTVHGPLAEEPDRACGWWDGYLGEDGIADRLERAVRSPAAQAVLLHFKSPGGTSAGILEGITRMLRARDAGGKPIVGFVQEACSAAYWIAAAVCDGGLYGPEDGEAGSVGSYIPHESIAKMLAAEGVEISLIADPPGKVAGNPYQALDELGRSRLERGVKRCTSRFMAAVEVGRGLSEKDLRALDGDILEGIDAVGAGLLDGVADLDTTISLAQALAEERARKDSS